MFISFYVTMESFIFYYSIWIFYISSCCKYDNISRFTQFSHFGIFRPFIKFFFIYIRIGRTSKY